MTEVDAQGRPEPPLAAEETATLLGFLDYQRATLAWKCAGLDAAGLKATVAASSTTLGGMLKHLSYVEDLWCSRWLHGRDPEPPWDTVDWDADRDWDWHSAAEDTPEQLRMLWGDTVARSRSLVTEALADGGLDRLAQRTWPDGRRTQPAMDPGPPDRGVRAAQRPCRPPAGVGGRAHRGVVARPTSLGTMVFQLIRARSLRSIVNCANRLRSADGTMRARRYSVDDVRSGPTGTWIRSRRRTLWQDVRTAPHRA